MIPIIWNLMEREKKVQLPVSRFFHPPKTLGFVHLDIKFLTSEDMERFKRGMGLGPDEEG